MSKHVWSSKWIFILAAVWSAAGLWNIWKFPFLVYDHGWGAFIIAYLVMLFVVWISILIWEIALGQKFRSAGPNAFGSISKNLKWLGWAFAFWTFAILSYYIVVIWWSMDYLYYSIKALFTGTLPWAGWWSDFFFNNILGISEWVSQKWSLSIPVFWWTLISLILLYFFTRNSAKSVSKVIVYTATLPFITLIILAIKWVTLPGAELGLNYILSFEPAKLWSLSTWTAAAGQIFFTLSLAMWAMIVYGAFKKPKSEIAKSVVYVALWNTLISLLSAFAVFGTLGYLATQNWVAVTEVAKGWPSLVFAIIPETLATFSSFSALFSVIFFITVFFLAIDSAMALLEATTFPILQKFKKLSSQQVTAGVIILLGLVSMRYMYWNGLYMLDILDYYIQNFFMLLLGFIEILIFLYAWNKFRKFIGKHSDILKYRYYYLITWVIWAAILGWLLIASFNKGLTTYDSYEKADLLNYGLYPVLGFIAVAIIINIIDPKVPKISKKK